MEKEIKKMNLYAKPIKTRWWVKLALMMVIPFSQLGVDVKITKTNFKKFYKGGCLVLCNHQSFEDVKMLEKAILPRTSFYISSIDEFCDKEFIMRRLGCIPKKVHFTDLALVRNLVRLLKKGNMVSIYPEATYSFAGVPNTIDQGLGKLAKMAGVPVYLMMNHGNYLYAPRWNVVPANKEVPLRADVTQLVDENEVKTLSADEIQERINKAFVYDEYEYQRENNIHIKSKTKCKMIERILYRCPHCNSEMQMFGEGNHIHCKHCGVDYEMDELGILKNLNGETKFDSVSKWFNWQRQFVKDSLEKGDYNISFPVQLSRFLNPKLGFDHDFAKGTAIQNEHGITIDAIKTSDGQPFHFEYNEKLNHAIHLTWCVKGKKEAAFEVHDANDSYLIYPLDGTSVCKVRFAVEEAHNIAFKKAK